MKLLDTLKEMRNLYRKAPNVVTEFNLLTLVVGECERVGKDVDDLAVLSILRKMHGANAECLKVACSRVGAKLRDENAFIDQLLEKYTPKQMTADGIIFRINQNGIKTLAEAMKYLKTNYAGQYDGKMASEVIKQHFAL
jgi:uncharacterized protein YqeY